MKDNFINIALQMLFPTLRIRPLWREAWIAEEHKSFVLGCRIATLAAVAGYCVHIVYIDRLYNLEPRGSWIALRLVAIIPNLIALLMTYSSRVSYSRFHWLPLAVAGVICTATQNTSYEWYHATPYSFSIVIPCIAAVMLRMSIPATALYMLVCYSTVVTSWVARGEQQLADIISSAAVALVLTCIMRSRQVIEVLAFISKQENLATQKQLIEREMELNAQIKAFLPREIYRRFLLLIEKNIKPIEAMEQLLTCKQKDVVCLYTDIRGFTQQTKHESGYVSSSVVPNLRTCTDIIETQNGITKLIGDLVFAYFDDDEKTNILRSLVCSIHLYQSTQDLNQKLPPSKQIKRYILLSAGQAIVGNVGGSEGSREITVLGTPANILSRIDPITKLTNFRDALGNHRIILTNAFADVVRNHFPSIQLEKHSLTELNVKIRDFEEEERIYVLPVNNENENICRLLLSNQLKDIENSINAAVSMGERLVA